MLYDWMMRSKIERLYGEMRSVENTMEDQANELDAPAMMARIDQLEERAIHLRLPTSYDSSLYTMRLHIGLIRSHLESLLANESIQRTGGEDRSSLSPETSGFSPAPPDRKSAE
jgi:hypothetical protein